MGVKGLTTYMNNQYKCFQPYELHDTYLIIDGGCTMNYLLEKCNFFEIFGGNFDDYAAIVEIYFKDLLKCNVMPVVIFDGSIVNKKLDTVMNRTREGYKKADSCIVNSDNFHLYNIGLTRCLFQTLEKLNIQYISSLFEADPAVASFGRYLNCPVLSGDSDFFIYNNQYIPLQLIEDGVVQKADGTYVKQCKIYQVDYFSKQIPGFDSTLLPLFAALLGNDYIDANIFTEFLSTIDIPFSTRNYRQMQIVGLLQWLQYHTIDSAITSVLNRIDEKLRENIRSNIEIALEDYDLIPPKLLLTLPFDDIITKKLTDISNERDEKIEVIDPTHFVLEKLPKWFLDECKKCKISSSFVNQLIHHVAFLGAIIEDTNYPSPYTMKFPILKVIYKLIITGVLPEVKPLSCVIRENLEVIMKKLDCPDKILGEAFPPIHQLRELPMVIRKRIMDETIEVIPAMKIEEIVDEWQLYVAALIYWIKQDQQPARNDVHVHALLFGMLLNIVDRKIGYYRQDSEFLKTYETTVKYNMIKSNEKEKPQLPNNVTIEEAITKVTKDDCVMVARFLISNCNVDPALKRNFNIDRTVVHIFNMFKCSIIVMMDLNALLGFPYQQPIVSNFINGTLFYNLCCKIAKQNDIDEYLKCVLQGSPTLYRLQNVMMNKVRQMCHSVNVKI